MRKITVYPSLISPSNKYGRGLFMYAFAAVLYLTTNHFPLQEPQLLLPTLIDRAIPFLPYTFWIYISEFALFAATIHFCNDTKRLNQYLYGFIVLQCVSALIFWIWPTTFPRANYPLPPTIDGITYALFDIIRIVDQPHNTTPSLHVSSVFLSSFAFFRAEPTKFRFFFWWSIAISLATLTTKQHYFIDILSGAALAVLIYAAWSRNIRIREAN